ncbi:MAG: NADH-quinone oxidoreductase subunit N [Chitinophagia bacterium]|nr:NADH-quinone oxidoreductase subunit N [Chitinophagia bacterium]
MEAIIATTLMGIVMMFAGLFVKDKRAIAGIAAALFLILLGVNVHELMNTSGKAPAVLLFNDMLRIDYTSAAFNTLLTACTVVYVLLFSKEITKVGTHVAEYFALLFFIVCGIYLLSYYNTLLMLFIGIEIMSIPQYILAGSDKRNLKSTEASLKYFLMGAFSTGILLMGIVLLYGATRSFQLAEIATALHIGSLNPEGIAGILFILVAMGFKVSAAPMHSWTPDVYDGTPTAFTAFMATIVKASAFFAFIRLFHTTFSSVGVQWEVTLSIIIALTLFIGNITAVFQQSVKRMLAYSSIAQAGFMLFALMAVHTNWAMKSIFMYAFAYSLASIGLFAVLIKLKDYTYDGFNGLAKSQPVLAFTASIFTFSLAGIPLTGGFMAKYYALAALLQENAMLNNYFVWLVFFALLMAAISVYYYFRVIAAMYFKSGETHLTDEVTMQDKVLLLFVAFLILAIGIFPSTLQSIFPFVN